MATSGYFETNVAPIEGSSSLYPKSVRTDWTAVYDSASMQWTVSWSSKAQGNANYPGKWTTIHSGGTTSFTSSQTLDPAAPSASMASSVDAKHNQELVKGSFKIAINQNGDASFTGSMNYHVNSTGSSGLCTASQTFNLDNIPLASTITSSSSKSITSSSVSALPYSIISKANYYHELKYGINESSATVKLSAQHINNTTYSGTITIAEILAKFPAATSGTLYLYLKTFRESAKTNQVGTTQVFPVSVSISANGTGIKPAITLGNIAVNSSPISGYLIAGYSTAKATVSGSSSSGSSISRIAYSYKFGSNTATNGNISSSSGTITTATAPVGTSNITLTITATAYDARGGSISATKTATVYGYSVPVITANIYRTSATSGTSPARDDAGTYVYISFSSVKGTDGSGQNSIQATTCTASGSITGTQTNNSFKALSEDKSATFTITSRDKVTSVTHVITVPTARFALELYDDKNGTLKAIFGGDAEVNKILKGASGASHEGRVIIVPEISFSNLGLSSGENKAFFDAWMKKVCELYPGVYEATFIGTARPASRGTIIWCVYYTSDLSSGMPRYTRGVYFPYATSAMRMFGTSDYTSWYESVPRDASGTQSGYVTTGAQTFEGSKTFNDRMTIGMASSDTTEALDVTSNSGRIQLYSTGNANGNSNRGLWAAAHGTGSDRYIITVDTNNNVYFSGTWNGDAIAVAKGGTGATTAPAAREKLQIQTVALSSGTSVGTTEVQISSVASEYQAFIATGVPGSTATVSTFVPKAALTSTSSTWQINTEGNYIMFTMRVDGEKVYAQVTGPSGTSKKLKFYGVRGA